MNSVTDRLIQFAQDNRDRIDKSVCEWPNSKIECGDGVIIHVARALLESNGFKTQHCGQVLGKKQYAAKF